MILLNQIVEAFVLTRFDGVAMVFVEGINSGFISAAFVNGDFVWLASAGDGLAKKS